MFNNDNLCSDCNQQNTGRKWCQNCNSKRFQQDFNKWTSGNELIDNFIQDAQLNAGKYIEVIEWIPYNNFRNIQYLAQGFSTIYKAIWLEVNGIGISSNGRDIHLDLEMKTTKSQNKEM